MKFDAIVVGAGFAGAVASRLLANVGKKVLVIERKKHLAGHCHDYKNQFGINVHTYGPHIFHTNSKKVWDFVNSFAEFNDYQHKVVSYAEGNYYNFPINLDTLCNVFGEHFSINDIDEILSREVSKSNFSNPPDNFRDAVVSQIGEKLYKLFYENYTKKQWERDPLSLSADLAKRIPIRHNRDARYFSDVYQGIPIEGYTNLIENILDDDNISIMLGTDYFEICRSVESDLIVYTGELDRFFDYKYGKLQYRSLKLELRTYNKESFQDFAVINYPNDYDWTRITEFKKFTNDYSEKTTVCFEYPKNDGDPYYIVLDSDNIERRKEYLKMVKTLEEKKKHVFVGRLAEYKYYNMDQVIEIVINKLESFVTV